MLALFCPEVPSPPGHVGRDHDGWHLRRRWCVLRGVREGGQGVSLQRLGRMNNKIRVDESTNNASTGFGAESMKVGDADALRVDLKEFHEARNGFSVVLLLVQSNDAK